MAVHDATPLPLSRGDLDPAGWRLLGQLHDSYILVEDRQGLLVVDQHVAHERVLYERYLAGLEADEVSVQGLLVPEVIETDPSAGAILEPLLPELGRMGIELEHFGGSTFLHKGHPDFLEQFDVRPFLDEVVAAVRSGDRGAADLAREVRQQLLISAACHAAVKINTTLVREKMERLLDDLLATENPFYCPHGRPIVLRFPLAGLEKSFLRSPV
jgi:DNA mismatch repair protein MutL